MEFINWKALKCPFGLSQERPIDLVQRVNMKSAWEKNKGNEQDFPESSSTKRTWCILTRIM